MTRFQPFMAWLAVGSAGLLAANAGAQVKKVGEGYLFRAKYAKGSTTRYQTTMQTALPPGIGGPGAKTPPAMSIVIPFAITVVSVAGDKANLKSDMGTVTMNGQALSKPRTMQMTLDSRGQPVGAISGAGAGMGVENMAGGLPEKPLKVGQSYTVTKTINQMGQNIQAKTTNTFMGIKNIGGHPVAEMTSKIVGVGATSLTGSGTTYFNVADGSLSSMKMTTAMNVTIPGQTQKISMKATMETKTVGK